jgi:sugar O-acyltransferase (sialic acid O-acetyltransferase NeuD family)
MLHTRLAIAGAGGAGCEAAWIAGLCADGPTCVGFLEDNPERHGLQVAGLPVMGSIRGANQFLEPETTLVHVAVGKPSARARLTAILAAQGFRFATLVHPSAVVADSAIIGSGVMIGPLSVIAPHAVIANHVLVNSHVGVGHHAVVGEFATLCPGARVSGSCRLGAGVFLGSNAVILPKLEVGDGATVAAASMVVRRVAPRHTVIGVPARIVSKPAESESTAPL